MNRTEWEQKYQEQCYVPVTREYMEALFEAVTKRAEEIHKEIYGQVDAFFQNLYMLQQNKKLDQIQTVSISFPYTSVVCGSPCLKFAVYPDYPFLDDAVIEQEFSVSWLFTGWDDYLDRLYDKAADAGMSTVIRKPYVKSQAWGIARIILKLMSTTMKYHLYGLDEMGAYQKLEKASGFKLYFGEYMDWQRIIFALPDDVDIFNCDEETDLQFCRFERAWYEDKVFDHLDLDDCRFYECTFKDCQFLESSFRDARFLGCSFLNCHLDGLKMSGARFDGCKFEDSTMQNIQTNRSSGTTEVWLGLQGMAEFIGCLLQKTKLKNSDFTAGYFRNCQIKDAQTEACELPDSFFDCIS